MSGYFRPKAPENDYRRVSTRNPEPLYEWVSVVGEDRWLQMLRERFEEINGVMTYGKRFSSAALNATRVSQKIQSFGE